MKNSFNDIRQELKNRMELVLKEIDKLKTERDSIDKKLQEADSRLASLRKVYESEEERYGPDLPLWTGEERARFRGMSIGEALKTILKEKPNITKKQAVDILQKGGYDFRKKSPLRVVHFTFLGLRGKRK